MKAEIKQIWDGDTYIYLLYIDGEHVLSAYRYSECKEEAERIGAKLI